MSGAILTRADVAGRDRVDERCDAVIIGTGPAGSAAARVLTEAGWDVVMLEEGAPFPTHLRRSDAWSSFKHGWRDLSFQVAQGRAVTPFLQGRALGGSSPINGAILHRLPESVHEAWVRDHGLGTHLTWADLERVQDRLDEEVGAAPTPEAAWGGNNALFRRGCEALGWESNPTKRAVVGCERTGRCNQACPGGRKQSMDVSLLPRVVAKGGRIHTECRAERLLVEGGRAVGVVGRYRDPISGTPAGTLTVRARKAVIVAAGAIHTPVFLLGQGLGRASRRLGKGLKAHPGASIMARFDEPVGLFDGATQGYETKQWWTTERMKLETVGLPPAVAVHRMPGFGPELMARVAELDKVAHWGGQIRALTEGEVRRGWFGAADIRWSLVPEDVARFKLVFRHLIELAFGAGARAVWPGIAGLPRELTSVDEVRRLDALPDDPRLFHSICAHLFGTAAMATDPSRGFVKPDGEAWALPGLFVVDASVFPTNLGVNPQHSIAAVAWILAEKLVDRR